MKHHKSQGWCSAVFLAGIGLGLGSPALHAQTSSTNATPAPQYTPSSPGLIQQQVPAQPAAAAAAAPVQNFLLQPTQSGGYATPGSAGVNFPNNLAIPANQPAAIIPGTAPNPNAGQVYSSGGLGVQRFGSTAPFIKITPPPASVLPGPPGTHKLQSLSGDKLYLDGGVRVRMAGVLFPQGVEGNRVRTELKEMIRTQPLSLEKEAGSPPLGDEKCRVWLTLPDGRNVAMELLSKGMVNVDPKSLFRSEEERLQFTAARDYAKRQKLGFWTK